MELPVSYKQELYKYFGEACYEWLESVDALIDKCARRWSLTNIELCENLSYGLICFADSARYGHVVLKTVIPNDELYTEMETLSICDGIGMCRCYDVDRELGAMLLERLQPGYDLWTVSDWPARLRIAADVIASGLAGRLPERHGLPLYEHWVRKAFDKARISKSGGHRMLALVDAAEAAMSRVMGLISSPSHLSLMHGDLHHANMLFDETRGWLAIDPKGCVGPRYLECARFIINEIDKTPSAERSSRMDDIVAGFGEAFGVDGRVIEDCALIDGVLTTSWSFDEYKPTSEMEEAIELAEFYHARVDSR